VPTDSSVLSRGLLVIACGRKELQAALFHKGEEGADGTAKWQEMFNMIDADGNGSLGLEEMGVFFKLMGRKQTELRAMYRDVDSDGNGKVSFSEFMGWFKRDVLHGIARGAPNLFKQVDATMADLGGKHQAVLDSIAADRATLAKITEQERIEQNGSNACAGRLKQNRALHSKLTGLFDDAL
jgi:hypothetical protein